MNTSPIRALARAREVVATEKIRGLTLRVLFPAGATHPSEARFVGRGPAAFFTARPDLLQRMLDVIRMRGHGDVTVVGQTYGTPIDARVRYALGHDVRFAAYDVLLGGARLGYSPFVELCDAMGLPRVPEIWRGPPSVAAFAQLRHRDSALARENGLHLAHNPAAGVLLRASVVGPAPTTALARTPQSLRPERDDLRSCCR